MPEVLQSYLAEIAGVIKRGDYREETFYTELKSLLEALGPELGHPGLDVTVLPMKTEAGNPDFRVWDGSSRIIGYVEAKKPGENLDAVAQSEQLRRYRDTFPNVVLTDFFTFVLYRDGVEIARTTLAQSQPALLGRTPPAQDAEGFLELLRRFYDYSLPQKLKARPLAERLARLTRFLRDQVIATELAEGKASPLYGFLDVFKKTLIADLNPAQFADLFAQTLTYGMFAARIRAKGEFNRKLAYDYIPHTLGVLREVFRYISLADIPRHLEVTLDEIAAVLNAADVAGILGEYQKTHQSADPIVHFYETFLAEYDPDLRERRGVYYTPEPVVRYIVESVHHLLKDRFEKPLGLAERGITLLDPAAGTLTFPAMAVEKAVAEYRATWGPAGVRELVQSQILPHFFAFELMMAPYAVGHLKIGLVLDALGYQLSDEERFNLYLTNALEMETLPGSAEPLLSALSLESRLAGEVKRKKPILVILGNPPYQAQSANASSKKVEFEKGQEYIADFAWDSKTNSPQPIYKKIKAIRKGKSRVLKEQPTFIGRLLLQYYFVDGQPLDEKNPRWLQDDYVKFIRLAQWKVAQLGEGVVAMITNHSYLDNPTFRGMRQSLLATFDEIYILNLHGNARKKETAPDGSPDENVFDIQQGVAIGIFIKRTKAAEKKVYYADCWGRRKEKYEWLNSNDLAGTKFSELNPEPPYYFFVPWSQENYLPYSRLTSITRLIPIHQSGIIAGRESLAIDYSPGDLWRKVSTFADLDTELARKAFSLGKDARDWKVAQAQQHVKLNYNAKFIQPILYRPLDIRYIYYIPQNKGFIRWAYPDFMSHMLAGANLGLLTHKQTKEEPGALVTRHIAAHKTVSAYDINYLFPLHLYLEPSGALLEESRGVRRYPKTGPELYENFLRTLAHRVFRTPLGQVVEIAPGHLFRLVAGAGKGRLAGAKDGLEALSRLILGEAAPGDLAGYERGRARFLDRFEETVTRPDRILADREKPGVWLFVKNLRPDLALVAVFKALDGERLGLLSFHPKHPKKLKATRYEEKWTPADPSRSAGSAGLGGGEAPAPGSSSNDYTTRWIERRPNLDPEIWATLTGRLGRPVSPEDLFAYVYAVLYTPAYREKYAEFLRVDFPRVPLTGDAEVFFEFAALGRRLIELHTLEASDLVPPSARFEGEGSGVVEKPRYDEAAGRVYINKTQHFAPVSSAAWNYRIGGYQVLEKWLKDRKGRELTEAEQYMKIVTAIEKTLEVQAELDGLWPLLDE